jgi:phosphoribosyl-ATP pyrophosphohydrolase/phosphoribosyl-AMP cyclohydrolase
MNFEMDSLAWNKMNGLLPVIVQDIHSSVVLMLGYMNEEALQKTIDTKYVTFFSRSKNRLWRKGETSGNVLELVNITTDCDNDSLLIFVNQTGPVCHLGYDNCFYSEIYTPWIIISMLERIILERSVNKPENSYVTQLLNDGINRIAQKVGEEAIEVIIAALEENDANFCNEVADLFFHLFVLLKAKNLNMTAVIKVLESRMNLNIHQD